MHASSKQIYLRILRHTLVYKWALLVSMLALVLVAASEASFPWLMQSLIDVGFSHQGSKPPWFADWLALDPTKGWPLWGLPVALLMIALVRFLANYINAYASTWVAAKVQNDMRELMFARLLRLPVSVFDAESSGVLLSKVTYDVGAITQANAQILTVLFRDAFTVTFLINSMLVMDWQLTLFCLIVVPVVALCVTVMSRRMRRLSLLAQAAYGELSRVLDEALGGQRIVKLFGGQAYEEARFADAAKQVRQSMVKIETTSSLNSGLVVLIVASVLAAIVYFASSRAQAQGLSAGTFMGFFTALLMLQPPLKNLTKLNEQLQKGLAAGQTVFALLDRPIETDSGDLQLLQAQGRVSFEGVSLRYGEAERLALDNVNLHINAGEVVALVGSSGGGKSTLATLLPRFYDPSSGRVMLDGHDLRDYSLASLRSQIAMVSQDVVLFNDTVAANIAYGQASPNRAAIEAAARAAYAYDFIAAMPQGFDTLIGENGARLSGGQRQRLAIARAIYKNAPILILDEATSALDNESERQVQAALEVLMQGRTTLVIAHRLSTIEKADRIVAMQAGQIVEVGSHTELLTRNGLYAKLYQQQFAETA